MTTSATTQNGGEPIAAQARAYPQGGLRDVVLWNITPFGDAERSAYSFRALTEVRWLLDSAPGF